MWLLRHCRNRKTRGFLGLLAIFLHRWLGAFSVLIENGKPAKNKSRFVPPIFFKNYSPTYCLSVGTATPAKPSVLQAYSTSAHTVLACSMRKGHPARRICDGLDDQGFPGSLLSPHGADNWSSEFWTHFKLSQKQRCRLDYIRNDRPMERKKFRKFGLKSIGFMPTVASSQVPWRAQRF